MLYENMTQYYFPNWCKIFVREPIITVTRQAIIKIWQMLLLEEVNNDYIISIQHSIPLTSAYNQVIKNIVPL